MWCKFDLGDLGEALGDALGDVLVALSDAIYAAFGGLGCVLALLFTLFVCGLAYAYVVTS